MRGKSNIYGAIGEIMVYDFFKKLYPDMIELVNTYNYDIILKKFKVDVKTKRCTSKPQPHYLCSVADFNTKQKCDFYFFVRVSEDKRKAYILGYVGKEDFYRKAIFRKEGEVDPDGDGIFTFKADCYNIKIQDLNKFKKIK